LDRMTENVQSDQLAPDPSGDWRADLRATARGARAVLHRHPWMVDFIVGRPPVGPRALQNIERALGSLDGLGLDKATVFTIVQTISTYALGTVLREAQEINGERYLEQQFAGLTDEERDAMLGEFMSRIRASGRYPHMASVIEAGIDPDAPETRGARVGVGPDCPPGRVEARPPRPPGAAPRAAGCPAAPPPSRAGAAGRRSPPAQPAGAAGQCLDGRPGPPAGPVGGQYRPGRRTLRLSWPRAERWVI